MAASSDHTEHPGSLTYIDLLVTMLMRHEKNLNKLVERLEEISNMLDNAVRVIAAEKTKKEKLEMLYI